MKTLLLSLCTSTIAAQNPSLKEALAAVPFRNIGPAIPADGRRWRF
jgi:hypothetical protein